ncbi:3-(3-hydroxy-phenyl)propionate transporter MhpT [Nitrospirillum sp. BR 11752]|uniref:AAHS family 3-hydroxyphenylpropionic acid transporter n=1 Tax=Nitrospirillum amazonense TaxID=28077 RepID=A0A560HGA4_9PROT|nr:3-(3-hydroxy-phenyl)propionate transporter MhpT [Nitrospirillum amazonense]MEE3626590.1 3-(3-hydroxy-phenyl)propionate transporter MhpT [Nitrospirillum sp. BR 11752]TWB45477.1 AAHS family 3-hydroxyphenylpropionic acid transporter [Nitrospirillum amazonense]
MLNQDAVPAPAGAPMAAAGGLLNRTTLLCLLVAILEGVDLQAAGVAAPKLAPALHLTPGQLGIFFSAGTIGLFLGALVGGRLADHFGRKAVLVVSVALFGLFTVATALSPDFTTLFLMRLATGLGLGGTLPNLVALAAENSPPGRSGGAVSLMYGGMPLGGAIVSLIAIFAAMSGGFDSWRTIFYAAGGAPLLVLPLLIWALPESRAFRVAAAADKEGRPGVLTILFGGGRAAETVLLWLAFFATLMVLYLLLSWLPLLMTDRGFSKPQAGLIQLVLNISGAIACGITGPLLDGPRRFSFAITVFLGLALFLVLLALMPPNLTVAIGVGLGAGAMILTTQATLYAAAPACYPIAIRGTGVGGAVAAGRLGSIFGPLLGTALVQAGLSASGLLLSLVPLVAVGGLLAVLLIHRQLRRRA